MEQFNNLNENVKDLYKPNNTMKNKLYLKTNDFNIQKYSKIEIKIIPH